MSAHEHQWRAASPPDLPENFERWTRLNEFTVDDVTFIKLLFDRGFLVVSTCGCGEFAVAMTKEGAAMMRQMRDRSN